MSIESTPKNIGAWLAPGVALMQRFRMSTKLYVMAALLLVPLVVVTYAQLATLKDNYLTAQSEVRGALAVGLITDVVTEVQRSRLLLVMPADQAANNLRTQTAQKLAESVSALDVFLKDEPALALASLWGPVRSDVLSVSRGGDGYAATVAAYSKVVNDLRNLAYRAGENSGLLLDPVDGTYYMQGILTEHVIGWVEAVSQIQLMVARVTQKHADAPAAMADISGLADLLDNWTARVVQHVDAFQRTKTGDLSPDQSAAVASTQAFMKAVRAAAGQELSPAAAAALLEQGGVAVDAARKFRVSVSAGLVSRLEVRQKAALTQALALGGLATVGILLVLYLLAGFSVATVHSMALLHRAMQEGTKGNLATRVLVPGKDELAEISREFEAMLDVLSSLVADVRSASSMVTHVGGQLVEDGHSLSQRTQSQAVSLEEATSNVGQVSDTVARNSEAAQEVSLMTRSLRTEADSASELMGKTVGAMSGLQTTSERMREIIGTIDGIAFQTNLLALNAAVEAARAGEQGKGFAVVAAEVRALARRSQTAAAEVRALIADSATRVGSTVQEIQAVSQLMGSLVTGISEIAQNVEHMAEGSAKQSIALAEVVQTVGDLDKVTVENSGLVDRTSHRSARLMQRSRQLEQAVTYIKLRQGTADEAMAMTEKAYALVQSLGYEQAKDVMHAPDSGFVDRDLYVFVFDRQGKYHVFSSDKGRVGTSLFDAAGVDAQQLLDDAWHRCEQGGGWVEYNIINLVSGTVKGKSSYVLPVTDNLLIGCGAYRSALSDADSSLGH
jgi:methyl-accepting chemotaxis protein